MARIPRRMAGIGAADIPDATAFDAYVGPARELTVDPVRRLARLHDGVTPGGHPLVAEGESGAPTRTVNANTTLVTGDRNKLVNVDAGAASRTITLPAAATAGDGYEVSVRISQLGSGFSVTVKGDGSELIEGVNTFVMRLVGQVARFRCNGATWDIIAEAGLVEYGSNGNGEYMKYADGQVVCWGTASGNATGAQGSLFVGDITWNLPIDMTASVPNRIHAWINSTSGWLNIRTRGATSVTARYFSTSSDSTARSAYFTAIGRWF
ncbi:hypothetical protein [Rhizobium rhizophilum]|uniref:Phage tail protein n=1 Tax=Rhizobium rhizophilum TaxID=1850373 RepID=A0ABY2QTD0_9HYPH|nr:hypothetical protein [Rhizobium rhizophilum]THV13724.1 hypothetical protein E9677_12490 [Rhizobium rhizophilum]